MFKFLGKGLNKGIAIGRLCFDDRISDCKGPFILCTGGNISTSLISKYQADIIGLCVTSATETSHAVIMAKGMGIPVVADLGDIPMGLCGKEAIVDGYDGRVYIEPDEDTISLISAKADREARRQKELKALIGKETITLDGRKIDIFAVAGRIGEVSEAVENGASGIGLFRSEFLFAEDREIPSEELQFGFYRHILEKMGSKPVTIRTFDIGGDKQVGFLPLAQELRGLRFCLNHRELFISQLRALYRASVYGNLKILLPMVNSAEEISEAKDIINNVKPGLSAEGIDFNDVPVGAMIETPAGARASKLIADEMDFLCIGTNDLLSYTLNVDRHSEADPHQSEFLRLLELIIHNAHDKGISVGICGELSDDLKMVKKLISMGADYLSVTPHRILPLKYEILKMNI